MRNAQLRYESRGYLFAFISAALFGSISTLAKPSVESTDPLLLAATVSSIAAISFTPLTIGQKVKTHRKDLRLIIPISILGAVIAPSIYFVGLRCRI